MPPEKTEVMELGAMCWPEVQQALHSIRLVVIPAGSMEQHGPHMTFETDTALAVQFSRKLAERYQGRVLVGPPISIGISQHHMKFPGSLTLRPETFIGVGRDIVTSFVKHGFDRFLFLNGHGGNRAALTTLCSHLRLECGVEVAACTWFNLVNDLIARKVGAQRIHACEIEASAGLYLAPQVVRTEKLTKGQEKRDPYPHTHARAQWSVEIPYRWEELTDNGAFGDASQATKEFGQELCSVVLERLFQFVDGFMSTDVRTT